MRSTYGEKREIRYTEMNTRTFRAENGRKHLRSGSAFSDLMIRTAVGEMSRNSQLKDNQGEN
jgi:hypothetical protein